MAKQLVKIVKTAEDVVTPTYATSGDAGLDLYSNDYLEIQPGHRATVKTGLKMEIPEGVYARIASRSGLASRNGIIVGAGIVDPTYRGEIRVVLFNLGQSAFWIVKGLKIAQLVFEQFVTADVQVVGELSSSTERAGKGFGSTDE
jgi:dUTP pyrophosphatase